MSGHTQSCAKWWVSFIWRMSWALKLFFCMWLWTHRSYKSVQSFRVAVVRHAQSDWKEIAVSQKWTWMASSFDYIICTTVHRHIRNQLNEFWSLMSFGIICECPLNSSLLILVQNSTKVLCFLYTWLSYRYQSADLLYISTG